MNIGDTLRTDAEREAAPIGAVIRFDGAAGSTWTKTAINQWTCGGVTRADREPSGWTGYGDNHGYTVVAWPSQQVGDVLTSTQQFNALPVGTVLQRVGMEESADYHWVKETNTRYVRQSDGQSISGPNTNSFFSIRSLPTAAPTSLSVGGRLRTGAEREAAPIGTEIRANGLSQRWTKTAAGTWVSGGSDEPRPNVCDHWLGDANPDGYEILALPEGVAVAAVAEPVPLASYEILRMLTTGTRFFSTQTPATQWEVRTGEQCVRVGDTHNVLVPLSTFEGLAEAGMLTVAASDTPTHLPVDAVVTCAAEFEALPVGTAVRGIRSPFAERTKSADGQWARPGHGTRGSANLRVNYYRVHSLPVPEPEVALVPVGQAVHSREEFVAMPVGTVVTTEPSNPTNSHRHYTKMEDGWRGSTGNVFPESQMSVNGYNTVVSYPETAAVAEVPAFTVDQRVTVEQVYDMAGVLLTRPGNPGSLWVTHGDRTATQIEGDPWGERRMGLGYRHSTIVPTNSWVCDGWRYAGFDTSRVPGSDGPAVGEFCISAEHFAALPVGTEVVQGEGVRAVKTGVDEWTMNHGLTYHNDGMNCANWWRVTEPVAVAFTIGMDIETVEQYAALPVYSVVRNMREENARPVVKYARNQWQDQTHDDWSDEAVASCRRTLVALPEGSVAAAPVATEEMVSVEAARNERNRAVADAQSAVLTSRNEEFLSALREHWDGVNFSEGEINSALSDLGLDEIGQPNETITVSVEVTGVSTLTTTAVEALFEGSLSAAVEDEPEVSWTIEGMDFSDIEVTSGECGCVQVDRAMVADRLDSNGVSYDSFDFERECENC